MKERLFSLIYKWFKSEIDELCEQAEEGGRVMCAQEIGRKMFLRGMDFTAVQRAGAKCPVRCADVELVGAEFFRVAENG